MTKELHCRDLGFDCNAVVTATTEEEIVAQVAEHARTVHAMTDEELNDPELLMQVHENIQDRP